MTGRKQEELRRRSRGQDIVMIAFATKESMARRAKTEFADVYAYMHGSPENVCEY